jgi:hypothetical protein
LAVPQAGEQASVSPDERKLQNELIFRDANERIRRAQQEIAVQADTVPFICECSDVRCHTIVQMSVAEYEDVRAGEMRFLIAPDHDATDGDVVERGERFWVLAKS